jgi:hypothetical protein
MKDEDSQLTMSRELQPEERPVSLVYRCWNFAVKVSFSLTFADLQRASQTAIFTRHVVAAAGDRVRGSAAGRPRKRVGQGARKVPRPLPLIFRISNRSHFSVAPCLSPISATAKPHGIAEPSPGGSPSWTNWTSNGAESRAPIDRTGYIKSPVSRVVVIWDGLEASCGLDVDTIAILRIIRSMVRGIESDFLHWNSKALQHSERMSTCLAIRAVLVKYEREWIHAAARTILIDSLSLAWSALGGTCWLGTGSSERSGRQEVRRHAG